MTHKSMTVFDSYLTFIYPLLTAQYSLLACEFFAAHPESHSNNYPWRRTVLRWYFSTFSASSLRIHFQHLLNVSIIVNNITHEPALGCSKRHVISIWCVFHWSSSLRRRPLYYPFFLVRSIPHGVMHTVKLWYTHRQRILVYIIGLIGR